MQYKQSWYWSCLVLSINAIRFIHMHMGKTSYAVGYKTAQMLEYDCIQDVNTTCLDGPFHAINIIGSANHSCFVRGIQFCNRNAFCVSFCRYSFNLVEALRSNAFSVNLQTRAWHGNRLHAHTTQRLQANCNAAALSCIVYQIRDVSRNISTRGIENQ